jgi:hypothetical protein
MRNYSKYFWDKERQRVDSRYRQQELFPAIRLLELLWVARVNSFTAHVVTSYGSLRL